MIKSPNWTQVPNDLLGYVRSGRRLEPGLIASMSESELKVYLVILRMTVGYHVGERELSVSEMCALTGLSENSVKKAAKSLKKLGLARRSVRRNRSHWTAQFSDCLPQESEAETPDLAADSEGDLPPQNLMPPQNLPPQNLRGLPTKFEGSSYKERNFKRKTLSDSTQKSPKTPPDEGDSEREIQEAFIQDLMALKTSPPAGVSEDGRRLYQSCQQVMAACKKNGAPLGEAELRGLLKAVRQHQPPAIIQAYERAVMAGAERPWPYTVAILTNQKSQDTNGAKNGQAITTASRANKWEVTDADFEAQLARL